MYKIKKICLVLVVTILFLAGSANAFNDWKASPVNSNWADANNWSAGVVPYGSSGSIGEAAINQATTFDPVISSAVPDVWVIAVNWNNRGTLNIAPGGSVKSIHWVILAHYVGGGLPGILNMTGGSLVSNEYIAIGGQGTGLLNFSGGTISSADFLLGGDKFEKPGGSGTVNMTGGTITTNTLQIGGYWTSPLTGTGYFNLDGGLVAVASTTGLRFGGSGLGHMDVTEGVLTVAGNAVSAIQGFIMAGSITAYGGSGTIMYDYDTTSPGKTTVWAVPGEGVHPPPCTPDYPVGDFTEDCIVNLADFAEFAAHWLEAVFPQNYVAPKAGTPPVIDGSLTAGEWNNALAVEIVYPDIVTAPKDGTLIGPAPTNALDSSETVYVTWDDAKLYIASRVYDQNSQWTAASPGPYDSQDTVQICFNWYNVWNAVFLQRAVIWDIVAETSDSAGADIYQHDSHSPFNKADVSVARTLLGDGCIVEAAIPWSSVGVPYVSYVPQVGDVHGFGLLLLDKDAGDGTLTLMADFGNGVDVIDNPNKWNTLTLGN